MKVIEMYIVQQKVQITYNTIIKGFIVTKTWPSFMKIWSKLFWLKERKHLTACCGSSHNMSRFSKGRIQI